MKGILAVVAFGVALVAFVVAITVPRPTLLQGADVAMGHARAFLEVGQDSLGREVELAQGLWRDTPRALADEAPRGATLSGRARVPEHVLDAQVRGLGQVAGAGHPLPNQPVAGRRPRGFPEASLKGSQTHVRLPGDIGDAQLLVDVGGKPVEQGRQFHPSAPRRRPACRRTAACLRRDAAPAPGAGRRCWRRPRRGRGARYGGRDPVRPPPGAGPALVPVRGVRGRAGSAPGVGRICSLDTAGDMGPRQRRDGGAAAEENSAGAAFPDARGVGMHPVDPYRRVRPACRAYPLCPTRSGCDAAVGNPGV